MSLPLEASFDYCQQLARRTARNFYYAFWPLDRARRRAMCALYAYLRRTDDLGDSPHPPEVRRQELAAWRSELAQALAGEATTDPVFPALADIVARYQIPHELLTDVIDGMEMDLEQTTYATFAELETYCYRVAGVVGLACIHIWGFRGPEAFEPARQCGLAFQLTNILRDLKEDAERGRIYLPQEDLDRFGYSADDLRACIRDERFARLMDFEIDRTERFYRSAERLDDFLEPPGRPAFAAMLGIYHGLLGEIKRKTSAVLERRVRLSGWRKLRITAGALWSLPRR